MRNSELAHQWAHAAKPRGKTSNMLYEGARIYSYGTHFCIARRLPNGTIVYGTHTYSSSTGKHQGYVRSAINHLTVVNAYDPDADAETNRFHAEKDVQNALREATTSRRVAERTRLESLEDAQKAAEDFNLYLAALPDEERGDVQPLPVPRMQAMDVSRLLALREELQAKREERWATRGEREERSQADNLEKWRRHEFNGYLRVTALRLSKDGQDIETSHGAKIPVSHAKRLWPLIENVRSVGLPLEREFHLGVYNLNRIEADGSIVVGCHNIPYAEIEAMARELGLLKETV